MQNSKKTQKQPEVNNRDERFSTESSEKCKELHIFPQLNTLDNTSNRAQTPRSERSCSAAWQSWARCSDGETQCLNSWEKAGRRCHVCFQSDRDEKREAKPQKGDAFPTPNLGKAERYFTSLQQTGSLQQPQPPVDWAENLVKQK